MRQKGSVAIPLKWSRAFWGKQAKWSVRRKTLLVTGAATVQAAAAERYDTAIINYCSDRASADTVAQMVNAQGCEAVVIRADITDPAAVAAMFEQITALPPAN